MPVRCGPGRTRTFSAHRRHTRTSTRNHQHTRAARQNKQPLTARGRDRTGLDRRTDQSLWARQDSNLLRPPKTHPDQHQEPPAHESRQAEQATPHSTRSRPNRTRPTYRPVVVGPAGLEPSPPTEDTPGPAPGTTSTREPPGRTSNPSQHEVETEQDSTDVPTSRSGPGRTRTCGQAIMSRLL